MEVDTIIYLHLRQKPPGRNFKKDNKVAIFTFLEVKTNQLLVKTILNQQLFMMKIVDLNYLD